MALTPRPFQEDCLTSLFSYWAANPEGNPLLVIPTGGGKSFILSLLMRRFHEAESSTRIVQVTHVKELIEQNYKELIGFWPWAPAGIYSASLRRREAHAQILFAGIQTVHNKARQIGHVDVLMVDEAHLIPPDAKTMYGRFIAALREINPRMLILGLTATPFRLDSGRLDEGEDRLFDQVAYEITIRDLIELGYLVPLISKATASTISVKGVSRSGGEFNAKQLSLVVEDLEKTRAAVDEIIGYGADRRAWLCFCSGVQHAHDVAAEVRKRGFTCETVHGDLSSGERDRIIKDFKSGKYRCLTNANVLTTGFNDPRIDLVAMLRPTLSASLYIQMVGRGTRCIGPDIESSIRNGKADCLVLDFAGNVRRHGPVDAVEVKKPGKGDGDAPVKECPACHSLILAGLRICPDCGHEFERNVDEKLTATAATVPIISKSTAQFVEVTERTFFRHDKAGGRPSVRVEYLCGLVVHKEWICPEHDGFARDRFAKFWKDHGGLNPVPKTIDETLDRVGELRETAEIRIRASGRYWEVCGRKLAPAVLTGPAPFEAAA